MSSARSAFFAAAEERGYIHQSTDRDALDALLSKEAATAYIGFDCTADSLHVGSLLQIMLLRLWQKTGNKPIVLMGGGTTKVGDPSGKDESRKLLSDDDIASNMAGIRRVFDKFLSFGDGKTDAVMTNNALWLDTLSYIPFLRDFGRHFSVNRMLSQDSVKLRLEREQPLSFLEFNYMVLQAYDFVELYRRHGCTVQMGGSDQWGNIVTGVELGRRVDNAGLYGVTSPLITTASGAKMGKTAAGAVWLNAERLSTYDYWQFWRKTDEADVGRFLRLFTELPMSDIQRLENLRGDEINEAKIVLANEATTLCHGRDAAEAAAETAYRVFVEGGIGEELPQFDRSVPNADSTVLLIELLCLSKLAASKSEARRQIRQNSVRVNNDLITDENLKFSISGIPTNLLKLSVGKKRHALVRLLVT